MNQNQILPDDPRLTAYALNEMAATDRDHFEKLLEADPAARSTVEDIRAAATLFADALEGEPVPVGESPVQRAAIIPGGEANKLDGGPLMAPGRILRYPQIYFMISGLAAACFAVFFVYWQQNQPEAKHYTEVTLVASDLDAPRERERPASSSLEVSAKVARTPAVTFAMPVSPEMTAIPAAPESVEKHEVVALSPFMLQSAPIVQSGSGAGSGPTLGRAMNDQVARQNPAAANRQDKIEEVVTLSPFQIAQKNDTGYYSSQTLAGGRLAGELSAQSIAAIRKQSAEGINFGSVVVPADAAGNTEGYNFRKDNAYLRVVDQPLSTFSVDVDTASYANVRRFLTQGQRPPADAVRIEELVNYFPYQYRAPAGEVPFAATLEVAAAPWAPDHRLVRIGLKGRELSDAARPAANLVFLLDVSGSMNNANKLPLVKQALGLLVNKLRAEDRVAIAVYAGASGLVLPSTSAGKKAEILAAIDRLQAGGSTNGALGIQLAYDIAKANFIPGGVNRVILATDGDFNVGTTSEGELVRLIGEKASGGVFLTVLGFGMGNLKDGMLEQIADRGNGNYAYIDSLAEARKSLVEQAGGTLVTIAKDVKIQVEFNPAQVAAYRLIGYENRLLAKEDFNNDQVDAGEIGAGHTVTALYEVVPAGVALPTPLPAVDDLKYQPTGVSGMYSSAITEMLTVKIRYKEPAGEVSRKLEFPLRDTGIAFEQASDDFKFAAAVAGFGMILRDSPHKGATTLADVTAWGRAGTGTDAGGYRNEFLGLVRQAEALLQ